MSVIKSESPYFLYLAYDIEESFCGKGVKERRIVDESGRFILSDFIWEVGKQAFDKAFPDLYTAFEFEEHLQMLAESTSQILATVFAQIELGTLIVTPTPDTEYGDLINDFLRLDSFLCALSAEAKKNLTIASESDGDPYVLALLAISDIVCADFNDGRSIEIASFNLGAIMELAKRFSYEKLSKSDHAKKAAKKRHQETDEYKDECIKFYAQNKDRFRSRIAVARSLAKEYPVNERTIDAWLKKYNQDNAVS